jgi:hypothetical protein
MGSINTPQKRDYGKNTRIDVNQSYQLAYWKQRFGISEEELIAAVRAAGGLARNVEAYLSQKTRRTLMQNV